jgi:hypothetical protein
MRERLKLEGQLSIDSHLQLGTPVRARIRINCSRCSIFLPRNRHSRQVGRTLLHMGSLLVGIELLDKLIKSHVFTILPTVCHTNWS